jgi:hypothetical protein
MRKLGSSAPLEFAHMRDLLPELFRSSSNEDALGEFNDKEQGGESKATRKLGYQDYIGIKFKFRTLEPLLGSQPAKQNGYMAELASRYPHTSNGSPVAADLIFSRSPTGLLELGADAVRNWLGIGLRQLNFPDASTQYLSMRPVQFNPHAPLTQFANPIIDKRTNTGIGMATFELLPAGQILELYLKYPSRFSNRDLQPKDLALFFAGYAPAPLRGISPAKGGRFGRMELIKYEVLSHTTDVVQTAKSIADLGILSQEAKDLIQKLSEG